MENQQLAEQVSTLLAGLDLIDQLQVELTVDSYINLAGVILKNHESALVIRIMLWRPLLNVSSAKRVVYQQTLGRSVLKTKIETPYWGLYFYCPTPTCPEIQSPGQLHPSQEPSPGRESGQNNDGYSIASWRSARVRLEDFEDFRDGRG